SGGCPAREAESSRRAGSFQTRSPPSLAAQGQASDVGREGDKVDRNLAGEGRPHLPQHLSQLMGSWGPGLFVGGNAADVPWANLDLERWFRLPKGHERRIHGHRHAGIRLVLEGATLMPVLDAHREHDGPFTAEELYPYRQHPAPPDQEAALHRRRVMRRARSSQQRPALLPELEQRYFDDS